MNDGVFPVVASDPKIKTYFENSLKKGNFYATHDEYAYSLADVIIVDINLDVKKIYTDSDTFKDFKVDIKPFKNAIKTIAGNCKEDVLILVETTVPPGTCEKVVKPIIENSLKERGLRTDNLKIGHSYERVMPGPNYIDSIKNFYRVYSGIDLKSADATEKFLRTIISTKKYPLTRLNNTNSTEYAKVLENSYRAYNIAFATEWSRFAEQANVNMYEVVNAIRMEPTHSNLMYPGIGVGGYCLTKDPLLASWSKINNFSSNTGLMMSENGVRINDKMPIYAFNFFKSSFNISSFENLKVLILGVSYRSEVGDTRFSPVEKFYNCLVNEKAIIELHDPYVKYWEETKNNVNSSISNALKFNPDIIAFCTSHEQYKNSKIIANYLKSKTNLFLFDSVGVLSDEEIINFKIKHTVCVLGRGDIN